MATKTRNNLPSPESSAEVATHIGPGTRVVGRLSGQEDVRVHGTIEGSVRLAQTLYIEPEGVALAEIYARDVVVSGTVVGNIHAESAVVLAATARVVGDIRSPRVSVEPGAAFRGSISMEPVDADALEAEATASRGSYSARTAAAPRGAISERAAATNGEARRPAPARQQQAVRLPPRRAQAFTAAAPRPASHDPRAWAPRPTTPPPSQAPARSPSLPAARLASASARDDGEDTIIVQHPAIRSSDDRPRRRNEALPAAATTSPATSSPTEDDHKKPARPRTLPRGKHKVERVD